MYSAFGFREFEIGDVDVVKHEGEFHLFHLVLPNHDYIAHAVSRDGFNWRRVRNALFIGDPGSWDDDMLWTMHVSRNPYRPGCWRLFYTGLSLGERGRIQRVGLAHSDDLYHWTKDESGAYPLEIHNSHYESGVDEGRHWVSFRDPFCFQEDGCYLLAAARVKEGPLVRRGCVALAWESAENRFEFLPPLFHPGRYDDVEVPSVVVLRGRYYLIGSTREDVKVHYWHSDSFRGPYHNFSNNVLMPHGNYAARVCRDGDSGGFLIWNFFHYGPASDRRNLLPPPKRLVVDRSGELRLKSFSGFDKLVLETRTLERLAPIRPLMKNPLALAAIESDACRLESASGMEIFAMGGQFHSFRMSGRMRLTDAGKCGLVFRIDDQGDGYYLSLDLLRGVAQMRAWSARHGGEVEDAYEYRLLQMAHYRTRKRPRKSFQLVAYEEYLEFSLDDYVLLSLADDRFSKGAVGFYVESAALRIENLKVDLLSSPEHPLSTPP